MMNTVIALTASSPEFGERASIAGIVTLQGMAAIFFILAALWGAIEILHLIIHANEKKPQERSKVIRPVEKQSLQRSKKADTHDAEVAAALAAALAASQDDGATIAAITAAISTMRAEQGLTGGFRVVSFRRAKSTNSKNTH